MPLIKSISVWYLLFSLLLYFLFLGIGGGENWELGFLHLLSVLIYFVVIHAQAGMTHTFYDTKNLGWTILAYTLIFIFLYNFISYSFGNNYFVFSTADALLYHRESIKINTGSFINGISNFLNDWTFEDLGAVLVISTIYKIIESNLLLNLFYLVLAVFSGIGIFKIGRYLIDYKSAYFAALTFSISSYFIWFNSSGLKESILVFLVIYSFLNYYNYLFQKKIIYIFYTLFFLASIMYFRPAITVLIIAAIITAYILQQRKSLFSKIIVIIFIGGMIYGSTFLEALLNRYLLGGIDEMIETKEISGMVKGGIGFTYAINILAGMIGPFPTISPNKSVLLSFYSPGLIYKSLISIPFWFGAYYIFKKGLWFFYPMIFFVMYETFSLVFILEALELRKSLPHFPFIYIIAFAFISFFYHDRFDRKRKFYINHLINILFIGIFILLIFWNYR